MRRVSSRLHGYLLPSCAHEQLSVRPSDQTCQGSVLWLLSSLCSFQAHVALLVPGLYSGSVDVCVSSYASVSTFCSCVFAESMTSHPAASLNYLVRPSFGLILFKHIRSVWVCIHEPDAEGRGRACSSGGQETGTRLHGSRRVVVESNFLLT